MSLDALFVLILLAVVQMFILVFTVRAMGSGKLKPEVTPAVEVRPAEVGAAVRAISANQDTAWLGGSVPHAVLYVRNVNLPTQTDVFERLNSKIRVFREAQSERAFGIQRARQFERALEKLDWEDPQVEARGENVKAYH